MYVFPAIWNVAGITVKDTDTDILANMNFMSSASL